MPVQSRRRDISNLLVPIETTDWRADHAGLWLDKYMPVQLKKNEPIGDKLTPQQRLVREVASVSEPETYIYFYRRWQEQLSTMRVQADGCEYMVQTRLATTPGRIAIGLGDESVIETAVTLHHTYGTPIIPGSALKGLAAAYAHRHLEGDIWRKASYKDGKLVTKAGDAHMTMFGTTSSAGYVTFFDALYAPGSGHTAKDGNPHALWPDVITVHHPDYYTGGTPTPPADWDSPTPVPFLTATGTYLIALGGPLAWVNLAFDILARALAEMGIGAKTSSGYGRMIFEAPSSAFAAPSTDNPTDTSTSDGPATTLTNPIITTPQIPAIGDIFGGTVLAVDPQGVRVKIKGLGENIAIGVMKIEALAGKQYRVGDTARVEVVSIRTLSSGLQVFDLKPGAKKEKK